MLGALLGPRHHKLPVVRGRTGEPLPERGPFRGMHRAAIFPPLTKGRASQVSLAPWANRQGPSCESCYVTVAYSTVHDSNQRARPTNKILNLATRALQTYFRSSVNPLVRSVTF